MTVRIGVLVSGSGTNLQALLDADLRPGEIVLVLSNVPSAGALLRAQAHNVPSAVVDHRTVTPRRAFDLAVLEHLRSARVDWVVLAGFMRILTDVILRPFEDRVINVHPALLPAFPGMNGPGQAHRAGVKVAGCTVHLVDSGVDTGPILAQAAVPVLPNDTEEDLARRILDQEHALLPAVVRALADGRLRKASGRYWLAEESGPLGALRSGVEIEGQPVHKG